MRVDLTRLREGRRRPRGELRRFYVKQVESKSVDEFSHMTIEELRAFVYGDETAEQIKH
jgi:ethanolamine ammonia-lyase large subunit